MAQWERDQLVNGARTPKVTNIGDKLIDPWPRSTPSGSLDLAQAPFRLLAIVNRMDRYDLASGRAGELRFVYSAIEPPGSHPVRALPMNFTVIFELSLPAATLADVQAWARRWEELSHQAIDSLAFRAKLKAITDGITSAANARANLRAVRTNEVALDDPWDLRHFTLGPDASSPLQLTALAMTPMIGRNRSAVLTGWMFESPARESDILLGKHRLPHEYQGAKLRGNFAPMTMVAEGANSFRWETDGSGPDTDARNDVRHRFSLFTCNGCHSGETATTAVHIAPRRKTQESALSGFMNGQAINDIVKPTQRRRFDDLQRRRRAMEKLICGLDAADQDRSFDE